MAEGLPNPKSREQLYSEMITEYVGLTGINDLNTGGAMSQFFDVVARSIARTSGDIFQILRDYSLDRATGEALNRLGEEERVYRLTSQVATGKVTVIDTSFEKIATKIYAGASSPNIGSTVIKVSDASNWPASGRLYIGRGTPNIEGPINYNSVNAVGSYYEITLDTPTKKFHNISESVILGQGGNRSISVGTGVTSPGAGATASINYSVSSATILLDGEDTNKNVQVVAQEPGSSGNAPIGAIREFINEPFPGASVINEVPFTTGLDDEPDDNYRDRVKKASLSKTRGTALAVKNAVLGIQASDENARVTSNEIDTSNPEQTLLYIDNGGGYEEKSEGVGLEVIVDSAIGGEQTFQLATGGRQTSVAKAFLQSSNSAPFELYALDRLAVLVGGLVSEHIFLEGDFRAPGAATAYEIVASINNNTDLSFEAFTADSGSKVVIQAKAEDDEFLQITSPSSGTDAALNLAFPSNEVTTTLLYRNRELLNKNGRSAFVVSKERFTWSNTITNGDTLTISVDGTDFITYTFLDADFIAEGQYITVSNENSLSSWVNVINSKVTGVTAEVNGEQIKLTSNLDSSNRASIEIDPSSALVNKGMFSSELGLSAEGNEADYEISRNTAQIKLKTPLKAGESLNLGSEFTRAEIQSNPILGGQTTLADTAYLWLIVDESSAEAVEIGVTAETFITVSKPGGNIVRYESTSPNAFSNAQVGDYVIIWSEELSASNRIEGRINSLTPTSIDIKVTAAEEAAAVAEGPVFYKEGFTIVRTKVAPQKIKVDGGLYNINTIASIINSQLNNATVSVEDDEVFNLRTNTEDTTGFLFLVDFNDGAKSLNFVKNTRSQSINSQVAYYSTGFKDRQFPAFVHGKITSDVSADPPNSYIGILSSSEDLAALGLDESGFLCFSQPYGGPNDVVSTECVEIEGFSGTSVSVESDYFYRRSRVDDRYHVLNGYDFGHQDKLVAILDGDPTNKTFDIPLYRTAKTNITLPNNANSFRAYDLEGGGTTEFEEFFGSDFSFDNYKVLMQAKNGIDPSPGVNEDAILYRATEYGRSGEKIGIGYFNPTSFEQELNHIVSVGETVDIKIFLKSGPSKFTTIDGSTEWNVVASPLSPSVDLVTYSHTGIGSAPGLGTIVAGDYVSILNTGEFDEANTGSYRIESATATSFTIRRKNGDSVSQSDVATLEVNTFSFFESADTSAQEIVDYTNENISSFITASILEDGGTSGAGLITKSTAEDIDFAYEYVYLKDGKNYILSTDLDAVIGDPQFTFKYDLDLPSFSTNTTDAYSFNKGEEIRLIPMTSLQTTKFINILAVTGYTTLGKIKSIHRNTDLQFSTDVLGTGGAVQIAGGTGTAAATQIEGSASTLGIASDESALINVLASTSGGFHSDQWVKVEASEVQKKNTFIEEVNSIQITQATPDVGSSKVELFNRELDQRMFGRNRYHTRTRGRAFKVEKQGQFTCISWDEATGADPQFTKTVNLNDTNDKNIVVTFDSTTLTTQYQIISGNINFSEVQFGDIVTISNFAAPENNGTFKVLGVSEDGKTISTNNSKGVSNAGNTNEIQTITFSGIPTTGDFALEFDGQVTGLIPYNANAATVEAELEGLSNIDAVAVSGDFAVGFTIEFQGINSSNDVSSITVDSNTLDAAINQIEEYSFTGLSGSDFDNTSQVEDFDFNTLTGVNFDDTNQIEDYDFAGVTGASLDATNQIEEYAFLGLTGSDFDIGGTKKLQLAGGLAYLWFNVTDGLNTQSDPGGTGTGIQVDILSSDIDLQLANKSRLAIDGAAIVGIISTVSVDDVMTVTYVSGEVADGNVENSGTTLTKIQDGVAAKSIQLGGGAAYLWFNVTDGVHAQTDPGGTGSGIEVQVLTADNNNVIANRAKDEIVAVLPLAGLSGASDILGILTVTYSGGEITDGADVNTGATFSLVKNGINGKSIQLGNSLAYIWFNVTDGFSTQVDPSGDGTGIQVDILLADDAIAIANKAAIAATTAAVAGIDTVVNNLRILTITYDGGDITDGFDVDAGTVYSLVTEGIDARAIQLGESLAYLWFNVTDGSNTQVDPATGVGTPIQVDVLLADADTDLASKAAAAVTTAAIAGIGTAVNSPVDAMTITYDLGDITPDGADINSGITFTLIQDGADAGLVDIIIAEEVKGDNTGDLSVTSEVKEGDSVIINNDFDTLNKGSFRVIRRFKNSIYIDNPNSVEEEVTIKDNSIELYSNNSIPVNLIFTNGSSTVTSVGNVNWTSIVGTGDFIKDASKGDSYYYKISSVDSVSQVTLTTPFQESSSSIDGIEAVYTDLDIDLTDFNIEKFDGFNRLKWAGAGDEPSLEDARPGDTITLGTDFSAANQGEFSVISSGTKLQEKTRLTMARGIDMTSGQYCKIYIPDDNSEFHLGFRVDGGANVPFAPNPVKTIEIDVFDTDDASEVAAKAIAIINNTPFSTYFSAEVDGDDVIITTVGYGPTTDASNVNIAGDFSVEVLQQGRRNYVDYINVEGVSESGITITDVLEIYVETMKFKEYEGTIPGDVFVVSSPFLGIDNVGRYVVEEVLNDKEIIVEGGMVSTDSVFLDNNFNKIYVEEKEPYVGYKMISMVTSNPANLDFKNIVFDTSEQFQKITELGGVIMYAMSKMELPQNITRGVDSYKFNTGLIGEANRVVYGDPRDNVTYEGVAAAGAEIFIKAPKPKRIEVSIDVRIKTGVPFSTIVEEVRNSIAALINSNDIGKPIPISNIISNVDGIIGVEAVAITSPQYDAQNDVIRINSGEKALVLDYISDIIVSKID
jgi:hypothetical protein